MPHASATALLQGVVDYAGLFPPAGLAMPEAVAEYRAALAGPSAWMLGRFVVPATRLAELAAVLASEPSPRAVSAIVRDGAADDLAAIAAFNAGASGARVDSIEAKPQSLEGVDWLAAQGRTVGEVYVEIAPRPDVDAWLARVAALGLRAKVRTGGLTADAFPSPVALAAFLGAAVRHGVPFKATAGLHHAVRGRYPLTYEPAAAAAPMYGYLNVLAATAALQAGGSVAEAEALLQQTEVETLRIAEDGLRWGARSFDAAALRTLRASGLVSFGSCSFREPAGEFGALAAC